MYDLRRLGWGEAGGAAGRAGYLLAKQPCTVQGIREWVQGGRAIVTSAR